MSAVRKTSSNQIIFIGAGPVGLVTAINLKEKMDIELVMLERYVEYKRTQRLNIQLSVIKNQVIEKQLRELILTNDAKKIDDDNIEVPIQALEKLLSKYADKIGIKIIHKQFLTKQQYNEALNEHKATSKIELEKSLGHDVIVDVDEVISVYPNCKMIIGADGSRSTVREVISNDEKNAITKTDFRNMIELKYEVEGKVEKLSSFDYFTTQALLEGVLCSENIKYNEKKGVSEVTLRFLVDSTTYNDKRLLGVNAKNLLPVSKNLPEPLVHAITMWLNKRGDKHIVVGSATINKTTLSLYASKKFGEQLNDVMLLLIGDAACGYPYMNGAILGIENGNLLVDLIVKNYINLVAGDPQAMQSFLKDYIALTKATLEKGRTRVIKADNKVANNQKAVKVLYASSYPIKLSMASYYDEPHPIFYSHVIVDDRLTKYVQNKLSNTPSNKHSLSQNLLIALNSVDYNFGYIKALLYLAYFKNREMEINKPSLWSFSLFGSLSSAADDFTGDKTSLEAIEVVKLVNQGLVIPETLFDNKGKRLSQGLHKIIKELYERTVRLEARFAEQSYRYVLQHIQPTMPSLHNPAEIVTDYLGLKR
jgi:2-polyprenyl-6-methoxyphenol hydroxylase-like FAD-dependent oxidoreductase